MTSKNAKKRAKRAAAKKRPKAGDELAKSLMRELSTAVRLLRETWQVVVPFDLMDLPHYEGEVASAVDAVAVSAGGFLERFERKRGR